MSTVEMTPQQAAHETRDSIVSLASKFMTDPVTYAYGSELGFEGMDFYAAGRGGVLGDTSASVVAATLVFFAPDVVEAAWERSRAVMSRADAAREWAGRCHVVARERFPEDFEWSTLASLLGRVVQAASVSGAPLFAGWRDLPEPDDLPALALHRLNALRELRGALHGAAVLTVGLAPVEAILVRSPDMIPVFGWQEAPADPAPFAERWALAEARTDRMFGRHLALLDAQDRSAFVDLLGTLNS
jgi:hypothetical protein